MASPFALFRKNQKVMMAVVTLFAMFAFVIMDPIGMGTRMGDTPGGGDAVVVESKYFDLKESDLERAVAQRGLVQRVLAQAATTVSMEQEMAMFQQLRGQDQEFLQQLYQQISGQVANEVFMIVQQRVGSTDERSVVEGLVLSNMAKQMGIQIPNERVEAFIFSTVEQVARSRSRMQRQDQVTGLTRDQFIKILKDLKGWTVPQVYEAFRREMMAETVYFVLSTNAAINVASSTGQPTPVATPIDRWNYYLRQNLRAKAEVLPVSAQSFVDAGKVANPTDAELTEFYETYKYNEPVTGSPEPGFKIPHKAAFQYFQADEGHFIAPEKITAEMIAAHYDANKSRYPYVAEDFSVPAATSTLPGVSPATGTSTTPTPTPQATANPAATATGTASTGTGAKPAASATPSATATGTKPAATSTGTAKPAASDGNCESAPEADAIADGFGDDGFESATDDCQSPTATASATATPTASATPTGKAAPTATATATAKPTATATATAAPSASATGTAATTAPAPTVTILPPLPSEDVLLPDDVRTGRNPQFEPLWRIEDKIRNELAASAARDEVNRIFGELKKTIDAKALQRSVSGKETDALLYSAEEWEALAKPYPGIVARTTAMIDRVQAQIEAETPGLFASQTTGGVSFVASEYSTNAVYTSNRSQEVPQADDALTAEALAQKTVHYLYWKTKNQAPRVPPLDEIKKDVELALKLTRARKLARAEAESLAKQARESGKPLAELFKDRGAALTQSFSWFKTDTSGNFNQGAQRELSDVDNVVDPGMEFMQTVFSLDPGQIDVAMNNPETICYVINVLQIDPSRESLLADFEIDSFGTYMQFGIRDASELRMQVSEKLVADADLKWLREPRADDGR